MIKPINVQMRFENELVSMVLDRFGHDIVLTRYGDTHFTVVQPIIVSPQFFAWIFALGKKAEIVWPEDVKKQMNKMLEEVKGIYQR